MTEHTETKSSEFTEATERSISPSMAESFGISKSDQEFFLSRNKPLRDVFHELSSLMVQQNYPKTISPALISNGLIKKLALSELKSFEAQFSSHWVNQRRFELFIPAAGAATRQLLLLRTILNHPRLAGIKTPTQLVEKAKQEVDKLQEELRSIKPEDRSSPASEGKNIDSLKAEIKLLQEVVDSTERFWNEGIVKGKYAFLEELSNLFRSEVHGELQDAITEQDLPKIANLIIAPNGLNYGQLPKLLMCIHSYNLGEGRADARLTFEEHIREAAALLKGNKELKLHFPISQEHQGLVDAALAKIMNKEDLLFFLERHGFKRTDTHISFSYQDQQTDSVSLLASSKHIARDPDLKPLLRKAGHGALLKNLSQLESDSIWINNVDNILYDNPHVKRIVLIYKRAMACLGINLERQLHSFIRDIESKQAELQRASKAGRMELAVDEVTLIEKIVSFLAADLQTKIASEPLKTLPAIQAFETLSNFLKRPVVVAGFVPLEPGQAGGGPFALEVELEKNIRAVKVNIIEQSEFKEGAKDPNFRSGEFFNPVMLFIARRSHDGSLYPMDNLGDSTRFFRSEKTDSRGQVLYAYERPGLWNGGIVKAFQVNIALPSCVFSAIKDIAGKESPLAKLHQPYSGPAICELDELRNVVDDDLRCFLEQ